MIRQHATSLALGLLLCVCPSLLVQCGGATEPGTETGNPPVLEERRLYLVDGASGLSLVAEPGAVNPGGSSVEIVNRRTGERVQTTALNDGSLSAGIPGRLGDEYDVTVRSGGRSVSARVSPSVSSADTLGALSCQTLENVLGQRVATGFSAGSLACTRDSECVTVGWGTSCYYQCGESLSSSLTESATRASVEADTAPICSELESRCERQLPSSCPPSERTVAECREGTCQVLDVNALSCGELSTGASARLRRLVDNGDRTCSVDADCALGGYFLSCAGDCGYRGILAAAALPLIGQAAERIEQDFCQTFRDRSCTPPIPPPCTLVSGEPAAVCNAGRCESAPAD